MIISQKRLDRDDRDGESCGNDAVPYLIEIDHNGKPGKTIIFGPNLTYVNAELYCDTPVCIEPSTDLRRVKRGAKTYDSPVSIRSFCLEMQLLLPDNKNRNDKIYSEGKRIPDKFHPGIKNGLCK